jgi:hypothetical protein
MLLKIQEIAFKKEWQVAKSRVRCPKSEISSKGEALSPYDGFMMAYNGLSSLQISAHGMPQR